ncbi:histidine phosphatase family protein [Microbulbifer taiwanensis]|uniref:Histidine phosphatase family protein n=1 Tax=Microbulbifer taiwanensis TaxID=986746 RepID=A0ABW1YQZ8_9GAMM|nr:histidine phosphatase family protein [Microbulbifer taiwanensis]
MTRILLVRHGEASKGPEAPDPELTDLGHRQAQALARQFANVKPISLISSPKARARQTAQPLAELWQRSVTLEQAVTEIPPPEGVALSERGQWIRRLLDSDWDAEDRAQQEWRRGILGFLLSLREDAAIFCHFMVINSVVAQVRGDRRVQQFRPDYTSVTELNSGGGRLEIVQLGEERQSRIL